MGVVQNSIDIQKIIEAGGDPTIAAKVAELEAEIGDENSGIIKDIDDLQEANAQIMTSVSAVKITADSAKATADATALITDISSSIHIGSAFEGKLTSSTIKAKKYGKNIFCSIIFKPSENVTLGAWAGGIIITDLPGNAIDYDYNIPISVNNEVVDYGQLQARNDKYNIELTSGYTFESGKDVKLTFSYLEA